MTTDLSKGWLVEHVARLVDEVESWPEPLREMVRGPFYNPDGSIRETRSP